MQCRRSETKSFVSSAFGAHNQFGKWIPHAWCVYLTAKKAISFKLKNDLYPSDGKHVHVFFLSLVGAIRNELIYLIV